MEKINMTALLSSWNDESLRNINADEEYRQWLSTSLLEILPKEVFSEHKTEDGDYVLDVEMKIQGIEVKFSRVLELLYLTFTDTVCKTADQFISEKARAASRRLEAAVAEFEAQLKE